MKPFFPLLLAGFGLAACDVPETVLSRKNLPDRAMPSAVETCGGASQPACQFRNSPVKLDATPVRLPRRKLPFYATVEPLEFIDVHARSWVAPRRTLTDGASIPDVFTALIGAPDSPEFTNAATIHDAYCGVGNEAGKYYHAADWRAVHRMFYDALRVGGTPERKAKVMYAAVYIAGPRWASEWEGEATGSGAAAVSANQGISAARLRLVLKQTIDMIGASNPGLAEIEAFADARLTQTQSTARLTGGEDAGSAGRAPAAEDTTGTASPVGPADPATPQGDPALGGATTGTASPVGPADPATPQGDPALGGATAGIAGAPAGGITDAAPGAGSAAGAAATASAAAGIRG